jgi:hypothetical protein
MYPLVRNPLRFKNFNCMQRLEIGESTIRFTTLVMARRFLRLNGPFTVHNDPAHIRRVNSLESVADLRDNCSICLGLMEVDSVRLPVCRHCFHRECLISWFDISVTCPLCRIDVSIHVCVDFDYLDPLETALRTGSI